MVNLVVLLQVVVVLVELDLLEVGVAVAVGQLLTDRLELMVDHHFKAAPAEVLVAE
jgi:hypothetical protein